MEMPKTSLLSYQQQSHQTSIVARKSAGSNGGNGMTMQSNISVMTERLSVSISDSNQSLNLVYERAIASIEIELEAISLENPLVAPYLDGLDYTPEATAERIVSFATSFFDVHRAKNEEMSDPEALDSYMNVIGDAIDKGFSEAREILNSLSVLNGDIKDNVDKTYDLVQEKLSLFKDSFSF